MNRLYRRTLLGGLGAWASSASARDARDGQPVEPDPVVPVGNVPFRLEGGVVLDISVNGGAPAPFVLDTMSVGTHLDVGFAAGLGLDAADAQTIQAVASGQATSGQIGRVTLRAAGIILPTQYVGVQVLPNRMVDRGRRPRLAGIIGLGGVGASIVRLNWAAQRLELLPAGTEPARGSVSLPVAGVMHFGADEGMRINWQAATISAVLDGMPIDLGITTWPGSSIDLNAGFVTENDLLSRYSKHIDYVVPVGITGRAPVSVATARRLELGTASIDAPIVGMARARPSDDSFYAAWLKRQRMSPSALQRPGPGGRLGLGMLQRFTPFLDVSGDRLVLEPFDGKVEAPAFRSNGLVLDKPEHGFFSVVSVIAGTPAAKMAISEDDRIVRVNGTPATDLALFDYRHRQASSSLTLQFSNGSERTLSAVTLLP